MPRQEAGAQPVVLVVDDDRFNLTYFSAALKKARFAVHTADSVGAARNCVEGEGIDAIDCVLADYRMPAESGLDLLGWLHQRDPSLSTIIITAEGEKQLVRQSLRGGAVDFLEKPVARLALTEAVTRGVEQTRHARGLVASQQQVSAVGRYARVFQALDPSACAGRLRTVFEPLHEVGGDFLNVIEPPGGGTVLLVGDVSGHDVRAAFISAYFQGMVRGLLARETPLPEVVEHFNHALCTDLRPAPEPGRALTPGTSLCVCACQLDREAGRLGLLSCGLPEPYLIGTDGHARRAPRGHPPLGWFADWAFEPAWHDLDALSGLCVCTDGLFDYAENRELSPLSVVFRLLRLGPEERRALLETAGDDILVMSFQIESAPEASSEDRQVVISEQYAGNEADAIDRFQNIWRRSLQFALPGEVDDRLYDFLLCSREAVLNALAHGCGGTADKVASYTVTFSPAEGRLLARIDDPGHGHNFDLAHRVDRLAQVDGRQLGLAIIARLSDRFAIENNGSTVLFEFQLSR